MPARANVAGRTFVTSLPLNKIVPLVGLKNFVRRLNRVVFPAPLGPINE